MTTNVIVMNSSSKSGKKNKSDVKAEVSKEKITPFRVVMPVFHRKIRDKERIITATGANGKKNLSKYRIAFVRRRSDIIQILIDPVTDNVFRTVTSTEIYSMPVYSGKRDRDGLPIYGNGFEFGCAMFENPSIPDIQGVVDAIRNGRRDVVQFRFVHRDFVRRLRNMVRRGVGKSLTKSDRVSWRRHGLV